MACPSIGVKFMNASKRKNFLTLQTTREVNMATASMRTASANSAAGKPAAQVLRRRRADELEISWPEQPKRSMRTALGQQKTWRSACCRFEIRQWTQGTKRFTVWLLGNRGWCSGISTPLAKDFLSLK